MHAAWLVSLVIWLKELAVGVVFFRHKEVNMDETNQSLCFEHYPIQTWEYNVNYYRFAIGFLFPLVILSVCYLRVLRAVGNSAGTQPEQKARIRQLVSSTVLIFLVCFFPYHIFLLVRTLLERDCHFIASIFNYYQLSLLLTSLNCVADPALYCFVSEGARHGLNTALLQPIVRVLCCSRHPGNATLAITTTTTDSNRVTTKEDKGHHSIKLLPQALIDVNQQAIAEHNDSPPCHLFIELSTKHSDKQDN